MAKKKKRSSVNSDNGYDPDPKNASSRQMGRSGNHQLRQPSDRSVLAVRLPSTVASSRASNAVPIQQCNITLLDRDADQIHLQNSQDVFVLAARPTMAKAVATAAVATAAVTPRSPGRVIASTSPDLSPFRLSSPSGKVRFCGIAITKVNIVSAKGASRAAVDWTSPTSSSASFKKGIKLLQPGTALISSVHLLQALFPSIAVAAAPSMDISAKPMEATITAASSPQSRAPIEANSTMANTGSAAATTMTVKTASAAATTTTMEPPSNSSFSFRHLTNTTLHTPPTKTAKATPHSVSSTGSSPRSNTTVTSSSTSSFSHPVWIIPLSSALGQMLRQQLCTNAAHIQLSIRDAVDDNNNETDADISTLAGPRPHTPSSIPQRPNMWLSRLWLAHVVHRHVQVSQGMCISCCGHPMMVAIRSVVSESSSTSASSTTTEHNSKQPDNEHVKDESQNELDLCHALDQCQLIDRGNTSSSLGTVQDNHQQHQQHAVQQEPEQWILDAVVEFCQQYAAQHRHSFGLYQITYDTRISWTPEAVGPTGSTNLNDVSRSMLQVADHVNSSTMDSGQRSPPRHVAGLDGTIQQLRLLFQIPITMHQWQQQSREQGTQLPAADDMTQKWIPRGILLYGNGGVGKTCMAKQMAHELLRNSRNSHLNTVYFVQYVHCATLQSQSVVVGQAERTLTRLFQPKSHSNQDAERKSTTTTIMMMSIHVLILDDIHLICPRRGSGGAMATAGTDGLASTLLALMDGMSGTGSRFVKQEGHSMSTTMILGITRNPSLLDPALRRPGRLDTEIEVPAPDAASTRAAILQFHLDRIGIMHSMAECSNNNDADWQALGTLAKGFNGADCMLAVKEAARISITRHGLLASTSWSRSTQPSSPLADNASQIATALQITRQDLEAGIRATKPSAIQSLTVEIPRVPWSSIGGMESVKCQLREAIEWPLLHADLFQQLRLAAPRGILLYGPPGCSKTLMARALATDGQMNFLAIKGPELLSKWLGESERALASLFRRARMASPCIVFLDEIDAIASRRGASASDCTTTGRMLSQLLTELDGIQHTSSIGNNNNNSNGNGSGIQPSRSQGHDTNQLFDASSSLATVSFARASTSSRLVVIGATNRPDLLDPALTRPGRMDRMIYVGIPDVATRLQILQIHLINPTDRTCRYDPDDVELSILASDEYTNGYSGAEMVALCRDAALLALEEYDNNNNNNTNTSVDTQMRVPESQTSTIPKIGMRHFEAAIRDLKRQITPEMLAFYESYQQRIKQAGVK